MLVLSRKVGEEIVIPLLGITITVVAVEGNRARLGVTAPSDIEILREEISGNPRPRNSSTSSPLCP